MNDSSGKMQELIRENALLKNRIRELEQAEAERISKENPSSEADELSRKGEERYRGILDNIEEAYYEVDLNGSLTFFNNTAVINLGYTNNEMMGMNFRQYVDNENRLKVFEAYSSVFITGESLKGIDWELISKSGDIIPVESSISLIRDTAGRPVGFRGIIRDITVRKKSEKKLREFEEKYRLLAENATDIIFTTDSNFRVTYISPSVTRLCGYTVEESIGRTPLEILTPASFKRAKKVLKEEMKIEAEGSGEPDRIRSLELELLCRGGSTLWTESTFTSIRSDNNRFSGFLGITRDIAERKQAEDALLESEMKFRNLTETALDAIFTIDMNGIVTYANPAAREMSGGKNVEGTALKELLSPEFAEQQAVIFESVRQGFSEPLSYETRVDRPQYDHPLYFDVRTSTLLNHGKPSGILFVARDTTERRRTEEEIRKMAIVDKLTGLFNRRGFITLAEQQIREADRNKKRLLLFFIDLDGLKFVNDTYGHEEGDRMLKKTARILKKTFREADIIGRLGGDEFAVLVTDDEELPETILKRLAVRTDGENALRDFPYPVSMSIGVSDYDPSDPCSIHELVSRADHLMYIQKKGKKETGGNGIHTH